MNKSVILISLFLLANQLTNAQNWLEKDDKYALTDSKGNTLTEYIYDEIELSFPPFYEAKKNNERYLLNKNGNEYLLAKSIKEITESTEAIVITDGKFKDFPIEILKANNLKLLMLRFNELDRLPDEFVNLTDLFYLDLNHNGLKELPGGFGKLNKLTYLNLNDNLLSNLPGTFGDLKNLKVLRLSINRFKTTPDALANLPELESLYLNLNEHLIFSSLCEVFKEYSKKIIISGDIEGNSNFPEALYISVPDKIIEMPCALEIKNLHEIERDCGDSPYTTHVPKIMVDYLRNKRPFNDDEIIDWNKNNPGVYEKFLNFENISFSGLGIHSLPKGLPDFKNLKHIFAENNKITNLPADFSEINSIETLILSGNNINSFPIEILELESLKRLYLDNNPLDELPNEILKLKNLNEISIKNCPIYSVSDSVYEFLKGKVNSFNNLGDPEINYKNRQLKKLPLGFWKHSLMSDIELQGNLLSELPEEIISLRNIVSLNLNSNKFETFPDAILECTELSILKLNNNKLREIHEKLYKLEMLVELELKNNNLSSLPKSVKKMKGLAILKLQGNSFTEQEQRKIRKWLPSCDIEF